MSKIQDGEITLKDKIVLVQSASESGITLRVEGNNYRFTPETIPSSFAEYLIKNRLKEPLSKKVFGTYLAMFPRGDRARAKTLWQEATAGGVDCKILMPELDIPITAAEVVVKPVDPTASYDKNKSFTMPPITGKYAASTPFPKPDSPQMISNNAITDSSSAVEGTLVCACNGTIELCDLKTGDKLKSFPQQGSYIFGLTFLPGGNQLLSTEGRQNKARIWDINSDSSQKEYTGTGRAVYSAVPLANSSLLLLGCDNGELLLFNRNTDKSAGQVKTSVGTITSLAASPRGQYFAAGGTNKVLHVWNQKTGKYVNKFSGFSGEIMSLCFSPEGERLAFADPKAKTVFIKEILSGKDLFTFVSPRSIQCVAWSPDGTKIAFGDSDGNAVRIFDVQSGKEVKSYTGHRSTITAIAFSPDGNYIATGSRDKTMRIWDLLLDREVRKFGDFGCCVPPFGQYSVAAFSTKFRFQQEECSTQSAKI